MPKDSYIITREDLTVLLGEYDHPTKLMLDYKKKGEKFNFLYFKIDLNGGSCVSKRLFGCVSGTEYPIMP